MGRCQDVSYDVAAWHPIILFPSRKKFREKRRERSKKGLRPRNSVLRRIYDRQSPSGAVNTKKTREVTYFGILAKKSNGWGGVAGFFPGRRSGRGWDVICNRDGKDQRRMQGIPRKGCMTM